MDFFNKAKEAAEKYTGSGDSSKKEDKKENDSIFSKAIDAVEKYHVKEKAVEYAQKQVAKREEEKLQSGYEEKKDKSIVDKAKEAAEDFLAKQGNKSEEVPVTKPVENNQEPSVTKPTGSYPAYTLSYPDTNGISDSFGRMNLDNKAETNPRDKSNYSDDSSRDYRPSYPDRTEDSGKYESYQEYWSRQGNYNDTYKQPRTEDSSYASDSRRQPGYNASSSYPSRNSNIPYYNNGREMPSYPNHDNSPMYRSAGDECDLFGTTTSSRDSYPSNSDSGEYYGRLRDDGRTSPNYSSGASAASGYGQTDGTYGTRIVPGNSMPYGRYSSNDHV